MINPINNLPEKLIDKLLHDAENDDGILAVILYGSYARQENTAQSDIDLCLVLKPAAYDADYLSEKKLHFLKNHPFDIQIFQQLPLYIRTRLLKEGHILYCRNEDKLYEVAFTHIREYADYEHIYREYLEEVARG